MSRIFVIAGTNGAGKSSVAAALFFGDEAGSFDPDAVAAEARAHDPSLTVAAGNAAAWRVGVDLLEAAIVQDLDVAIETTLGGSTIVSILERAADAGHEVRVLFVGLVDVELHLARVAARVARGGHDIPESRIRERFDRSREHVIRLFPHLTELRVLDNSAEADLRKGIPPVPLLVLHVATGQIVDMCSPTDVPQWAKPIVAAALGLNDDSAGR